MEEKRRVPLDRLGICEHCQAILHMDVPPGAIQWRCAECKTHVDYRSFGYELGAERLERIHWVGPDGKWATEKPSEDFELGEWMVIAKTG